MPSPLAHVAATLSLYAALLPAGARLVPGWKALGLLGFASVAPDMDIPLGIALGDPVGWHHGPTHSLLGAGLAGLALAGLARWASGGGWAEARTRALAIATASGCLLHVPLDWSTGNPVDAAKFGVPLFWPLLETKYIAGWTLFGAYHIDKQGFLLNMIAPEALPVWGRELLFVAGVLALGLGVRRLRAGRSP